MFKPCYKQNLFIKFIKAMIGRTPEKYMSQQFFSSGAKSYFISSEVLWISYILM